jgi:translation initiation factor 1
MNSNITNLTIKNASLKFFDEESDGEDLNVPEHKVHIRAQQYRGRKMLTTIGGLASDLDLKAITRCWKTHFNCSGNVVFDEKSNSQIIKLSGDQRLKVKEFLVGEGIVRVDEIIIAGA